MGIVVIFWLVFIQGGTELGRMILVQRIISLFVVLIVIFIIVVIAIIDIKIILIHIFPLVHIPIFISILYPI